MNNDNDTATVKKDASDAMLGLVQRQAMAIVALPPEEREERYLILLESLKKSAKQLPAGQAWYGETADKVVQWTRDLVAIIETGGGGTGGAA